MYGGLLIGSRVGVEWSWVGWRQGRYGGYGGWELGLGGANGVWRGCVCGGG